MIGPQLGRPWFVAAVVKMCICSGMFSSTAFAQNRS